MTLVETHVRSGRVMTVLGPIESADMGVTIMHEHILNDCRCWWHRPTESERQRLATEPVVHKTYGDSFEATDLEELLAERGVGRLVVTGAQTEACIRSTLHGALVRGYDTTLVADAHTTEDLREWGFPVSPEQSIGYTNMYWSWASAPGRAGVVTPTADVDFTT